MQKRVTPIRDSWEGLFDLLTGKLRKKDASGLKLLTVKSPQNPILSELSAISLPHHNWLSVVGDSTSEIGLKMKWFEEREVNEAPFVLCLAAHIVSMGLLSPGVLGGDAF